MLLIFLSEHFILWLWRPYPGSGDHRNQRKWCCQPSSISVWPALSSMGKGAGQLMEGLGFLHWFSPLKTKKEIRGVFHSVHISRMCSPSVSKENNDFQTLNVGWHGSLQVIFSEGIRALPEMARVLGHRGSLPCGGCPWRGMITNVYGTLLSSKRGAHCFSLTLMLLETLWSRYVCFQLL